MNTIPGSGELFKQEIINRIIDHGSVSRVERYLIDSTNYGREYMTTILVDPNSKYEDVHKIVMDCFAPKCNQKHVEIHDDEKFNDGCGEFILDTCQYKNECGKCKIFRATIVAESHIECCDISLTPNLYMYNFDQISNNLTRVFGKHYRLAFRNEFTSERIY